MAHWKNNCSNDDVISEMKAYSEGWGQLYFQRGYYEKYVEPKVDNKVNFTLFTVFFFSRVVTYHTALAFITIMHPIELFNREYIMTITRETSFYLSKMDRNRHALNIQL